MKKFSFLVLAILVLFVTNPTQPEFIEWTKNQMTKGIESNLLKGITNIIRGFYLENFVTRKNYYLFSVYEAQISDENNIKVLGILKNYIRIQDSVKIVQ